MNTGRDGEVNLQATISSSTTMGGDYQNPIPHHPITCSGGLYFDEEGALSCDHTKDIKDARTQAACVHSLAILIIEFASGFTGMTELPYDRREERESVD